ncbi:hypothetical protein P8452_17050 [Trifolium repens]|nr:hypothetical protein P8452_17050 [Trifolium repens]
MAEETHTGVEQMDTDGAENSNQGGQPPIFTTQESQPPTAESQGIQPLIATESTPIATENTTTADPAALPPQPSKKRKPNASGPRKTSPAWDHFTKLPDSEVANPTAACNYCGKSIHILHLELNLNMLLSCNYGFLVLVSTAAFYYCFLLMPSTTACTAACHTFSLLFVNCECLIAYKILACLIKSHLKFKLWFIVSILSIGTLKSPSTNCFLPTAACYKHSLLFGNCQLFYPNCLLLQFCKHCSFNYYASDYEIERCKKGSCNCAIVADHIEGGIVGEFDEANHGLFMPLWIALSMMIY